MPYAAMRDFAPITLGIPQQNSLTVHPSVLARSAKGLIALAPAATPKEIIARLHKDVVAILKQPDTRARFTRDGAEVVAEAPEKLGAYIRAEAVKWD